MSAVKAGDALLSESLAPAGHKAPTTLDPLGGFIPRMPIGQQAVQSGMAAFDDKRETVN